MKALVFLLQLVGLSLLGAGPTWLYFTHPPIHYEAPWYLGHFHIGLPDSLQTREQGDRQALQIALQATQTCRGQLDSQNASIAVLSAKSAAALARAEHDVQSHAAVAESYRQASIVDNAYKPVGDDVCARFKDADRVVVGSLGQ